MKISGGSMNEQTIIAARELLYREHDLLNTRTNIFLVVQAIFLGGFSVSLSLSVNFAYVIVTIGFFYSIMWLSINNIHYKSYKKVRKLLFSYEKNCPKKTEYSR